jgi:hypothetical protein
MDVVGGVKKCRRDRLLKPVWKQRWGIGIYNILYNGSLNYLMKNSL